MRTPAPLRLVRVSGYWLVIEWANSRNGRSRFESTRLHPLVDSVCGLRFEVKLAKLGKFD